MRRLSAPGLLVACALCLCLSLLVAAPAKAQSVQAGERVIDVLESLRSEGWPIVYSSNAVDPELRVVAAPQAQAPLEQLREILAPHGLAVEISGPAYLIVRAAAPPTAPVTIEVVSRSSGQALENAAVSLGMATLRSLTDAAGRASFADVPAGEQTLTVRRAGFMPVRTTITAPTAPGAVISIALDPLVVRLEELVVTASRYDVAGDPLASGAYFSRDEVESLSDLGNDPVRAVNRLPGIAANGFSAKAFVRGGNQDEMNIFLGGQELVDPFHARDYLSPFSAIDQRIIAGMQIYSGGYPAAYGDALSGIMLIEPLEPEPGAHYELGLSLLTSSALSRGRFADNAGKWILSARRSNLDFLVEGDRSVPKYYDVFAELGYALSERQELSLNWLLASDDILVVTGSDDGTADSDRSESETHNRQLWLTLDSQFNDRLSARTLLSVSEYSNGRAGTVNQIGQVVGTVEDNRTLSRVGFKQDWQWGLQQSQVLSWGLQLQDQDASYDYTSQVELLGPFATLTGAAAATERSVQLGPDGTTLAAYVSDRIQLSERWITEIGLRWDKQTHLPGTGNDQFSPRASLLVQLGPATDLRLSWGRFFQAQGLVELQVEDGVEAFPAAQQAVHSILSLEHDFAHGLLFRAEVFRKTMSGLWPRYENLFDPVALVPELQPGRVEIDAPRAAATGIELFLNQEYALSRDRTLSWWLSYTHSEVEDRFPEGSIPRSWDQPHAVSASVSWQNARWLLSGTFTQHTGWPTTMLELESAATGNGEPLYTLVPGPRNAVRLHDFRQLDLRASRTLPLRSGQLRTYLEITNALDRKNPCCANYELSPDSEGALELTRTEDYWLPRLLNIGMLWEF
jgi:hypothetical protein